MPQRITLGDALDLDMSAIPSILNLPPTDPRSKRFVNRAIERLLPKGKWVGTCQKYHVCAYSGCLTWPRQFETIEAVAICDRPIPIRNDWFEFNEMGFGLRKETDGIGTQLYDRGMACTFDDIHGLDKKIKVYCDIDEGPTPSILLQGYDENGNWIRTLVSGQYVDGEYVVPTTTGTLTTHKFISLTGVQKPITDGTIRIYSYSTTTTEQVALAFYEPDETRPVYRRSLIAGLSNLKSCCVGQVTDSACDKKPVTVIAKMSFIPARNNNDWLLITSLPAIEAMCQALRKEQNNLWDEAKKYESQAVEILNEQLNAFMGDSVILAVRMPDPSVYGAAVGNVIGTFGFPNS